VQYALFGGGDWGSWCDSLFRELGNRGHAAIVAAGQLDAGADAVAEFRRGAVERLARVGVRSVHVPLLRRSDADRAQALESLGGAGFVYVLGGGPDPTVRALRGSRFWAEVLRGDRAYVGSSGGSMLLGAWYPTSLAFESVRAGLAVFKSAVIVPHWDQLDVMSRGLRERFIAEAADGVVVGIDGDTCLRGDGHSWRVVGRGSVQVRREGTWCSYEEGVRFELPLADSGSDNLIS